MINYKLCDNSPKTAKIPVWMLWIGKYWFQIVLSFLLFHLYTNRDVNLFVNLGASATPANFVSNKAEKVPAILPSGEDVNFSIGGIVAKPALLLEDQPAQLPGNWKSSDFRNLSFIFDPDLAKKKKVPQTIVDEKTKSCRNYVERFAASAVAEMNKYGIPASITMAQGLLETDAGGSRLASESNNHFGIKCRSKCRGCTCRNYSDDDIYDMFRVFDSAWESYREHSVLLSGDRYKHLKKLGTKDYKGWAVGLKKAGYATDKKYDEKLIKIIEALDLMQFDQ